MPPASLDGAATLPLDAAPLFMLPAEPEAGWFCTLESAGAAGAGVVAGNCDVVVGRSFAGAPVLVA